MSRMRGEAKVGGYTLVYDAFALYQLEKLMEVKGINSLLAAINDMGDDPSMGVVLKICTAGLLFENPDATIRDASDLINEVGLKPATETAMTALTGALPQDDGEEEVGNGLGAKKMPGRGKSS